MRKACAIAAVGLCLAIATPCWAHDTIKKTSGTVSGKIKSMSPASVTIEKAGGGRLREDVPVNIIETIYFDQEPAQMRTIRAYIRDGQYEDALESLDGLKLDEIDRDVILQDIEFYKALCKTKLALGGTGQVLDAAKVMGAFRKKNSGNYHYLEATELMGNLALTLGRYSEAEELYTILGRAPWPDYKMRAAVAMGYSRLAQNKPAEARKAFNFALSISATDALARKQQLAAKLGIARCDAAAGQHDKAVAAVLDILSRADPENVELQAKAYNTLGTAYRKAGKTKDALWAFLHVDILYFGDQESHAEALWNLESLWKALHKPDRALRARRILDTRYKNSRWAK